MKVRLQHLSFYLLISIVLLSVGWSGAFTCPDQCSCVEVQRKRLSYNHAKCTSLEGLRQLGKTSDLHSLDLSAMNLTKINNQLDKLTNLSKVDLSENRLSEINSLGAKRIRILNLSGNRITSGKLGKVPATVKHLNLSHNDITILTDAFKRFIHLKSLELAHNPINCTCETLDIRNWLQERNVWTEKPIQCMAPLKFKGRSWLQIRQSEVCDPHGLESPRMLPFSDTSDDVNDLMLGDDPNAGDSEEKEVPPEDDIEPDFLRVEDHKLARRTEELDVASDFAEDEGSGYESDENIKPKIDLLESEGSGDETEHIVNHTEPKSNDDVKESMNNSSEIIVTSNDTGESTTLIAEGTFSSNGDTENTNGDSNKPKQSEKIENNPVHESKSTYILLAILGVLLIALILYVATKRSKNSKGGNRRNKNDIESPAQEMLKMDKRNLGKPIQNPVEFIPLIPEKHSQEKKPNICNGEEPLLQKLNEVGNENDANDDVRDGKGKQAPAQQLNGVAKPKEVHSDKSDDKPAYEHPQSQPISPKNSRYSPVNIPLAIQFQSCNSS